LSLRVQHFKFDVQRSKRQVLNSTLRFLSFRDLQTV
jgi:hypothetical protein